MQRVNALDEICASIGAVKKEKKREREGEKRRDLGASIEGEKFYFGRNSLPEARRFGKQSRTRIPGKGRKVFSGPGCWNKLRKTTYLPVAGRKTTLKYDSRGDLAPLV